MIELVDKDTRSELLQRGFCVIPGIVTTELLTSLRMRFRPDSLTKDSANFSRAGAFINLDLGDPLTVELLTWQVALDLLQQAGWPNPKLHSFYVSTKQPHSEGLVWHSDVFYDYQGMEPPEVFLLYYLDDTNPTNGCLRVVPGSHLRSNITQEALHTEKRADSRPREGEIDIPIRAGDLFIGDRRLLHATHPNDSEAWRTCITVSYAPDFARLPETVKELVLNNPCLPSRGWRQEEAGLDPRLVEILPVYEGV